MANTTQTLSGDCLIGELEFVIEKEKPKFLLYLNHQQFLINDDFEQKQDIKKTTRLRNRWWNWLDKVKGWNWFWGNS